MSQAKNSHIRFQRGNFVVTDLDRALSFYVDVLGFKLNFIKDSPEDSYSYPVFGFDRSKPLRFAVLDTPDQVRVMALTEVIGGELEPAPLPRRSAIVIEVGDVDAVLAGANEIGCEAFEEEELHTHDGRVGREVGLLDWDGNLTVIYHIPKKS